MSIKKRTILIIGTIAIVALFCFNVHLVKDSENVTNISLSSLKASASELDGETCYTQIVEEGGVPGRACYIYCFTCSSCGGQKSTSQ